MPWWAPEDFIEKVERQWIKVRWINWPAIAKIWDNLMYVRWKKPEVLEWTENLVCKLVEVILEEPETHTHWIRKRIKLEGCWDELFNPENFKITI